MKTAVIVFTMVTIAEAFFHNENANLEVKTASGPIQGKTVDFQDSKVLAYLGIPFAKPPVGELRFKKPVPMEKWSKPIMADSMPPACVQYNAYPFPWYDFEPGKSEDCLYLNIWAPQGTTAHSEKTVMVWIFGGGFTLGSNRKDLYDGRVLAQNGDVIVVTINYRLGLFGFLTSGTEDAPGNAGMYDMLLALKWVNKNIEAFGGDAKKITVFGQSAGSIAIGLLCVSPLTKGLFQRVIMESGSQAFLIENQKDININLSQKLANAVWCASNSRTIRDDPQGVIECLRGKDAENLAEVLASFNPTSARSFFPQYGDKMFPNNAAQDLKEGKFHKLSVLIGNNKDEGSFQISTGNPDLFGFFGEKDPAINKTLGAQMLRKTFSSFSNPDEVVNFYLGDVADDDYDEIRYRVYTASGDFSLLCPTVYFAESYGDKGNDVFYYFFEHRPSTTPWAPWMGVAHFEEIQFVFGLPIWYPKEYTWSERLLSQTMMHIWTQFAKTGYPPLPSLWPKYSSSNHQVVRIGTKYTGLSYGQGPHLKSCNFLRSHFGF